MKKARQQVLTGRIAEGVYPVQRMDVVIPCLVVYILPFLISAINCEEDSR